MDLPEDDTTVSKHVAVIIIQISLKMKYIYIYVYMCIVG